MLFSNLVHLKGLLMVLTAAVGTVASGTMLSSYVNGSKAGPSFLLTVNPSTLSIEQGASLTSTVSVMSVRGFSGTVSLSLFFTGSNLPASLTPSSVSVPVNGTAKSTLTVNATSTVGSYDIVVIGIATVTERPTTHHLSYQSKWSPTRTSGSLPPRRTSSTLSGRAIPQLSL